MSVEPFPTYWFSEMRAKKKCTSGCSTSRRFAVGTGDTSAMTPIQLTPLSDGVGLRRVVCAREQADGERAFRHRTADVSCTLEASDGAHRRLAVVGVVAAR